MTSIPVSFQQIEKTNPRGTEVLLHWNIPAVHIIVGNRSSRRGQSKPKQYRILTAPNRQDSDRSQVPTSEHGRRHRRSGPRHANPNLRNNFMQKVCDGFSVPTRSEYPAEKSRQHFFPPVPRQTGDAFESPPLLHLVCSIFRQPRDGRGGSPPGSAGGAILVSFLVVHRCVVTCVRPPHNDGVSPIQLIKPRTRRVSSTDTLDFPTLSSNELSHHSSQTTPRMTTSSQPGGTEEMNAPLES